MELSPPAQRVLGCLAEKALSTPQQYPLTRNALRTACNQATNRDPVVDYDDNQVEAALADLRESGLVRTEVARGSRTPKYAHRLDDALGLTVPEQAVVALLLLRGPQTPGELRTRSERLHRFGAVEQVDEVLETLAHRDLVRRLERAPGQKESRWHHRLGSPDDQPAPRAAAPPAPTPAPTPPSDELAELRARVERLEAQVAELRER